MNIDGVFHTATLPHRRTRLAPTPSGYLHLGNVFSFALTAALARRAGASILLRIDDLDRGRLRPHYLQDIFDTLNFLELPYDEGPADAAEFEEKYSQRHRIHLYNEALEALREEGAVFACTCSRSGLAQMDNDTAYADACFTKNLPLDTPGACWRLITNEQQSIVVKTIDGEKTNFLPSSLTQFIVRKKDGWPSYQLASLIDDLHYDVDLVVRGADLWPSTLAQHYLADVLSKPAFFSTLFYHHLLLKGSDAQKLSKSAGSTSVYGLRKEGKSREDIYALIAQALGLKETAHDWQSLADAFGWKEAFE